ncbi:secreted antigen 1 [Babesia divergens]|uniref:Secreted antigen 1 n=1 Tax=Babesia divergens TaxID=32595 RepID=A0AAD9LG13_BABDI|nr:secreted antigen 1 [Babesia divergens]
MATQECKSFPEPKNLKEILELFEKLNGSSTAKKNVGQKLLKDVRKYCKETTKFYQSGSHSEVLWNVFSGAKSIRSTILKNSGTYPKYNDLESSHGKHEDCIAEALKKCLPKAFAALYFLYFMGSEDMSTLQGGDWSNQSCNGSGGSKNIFYNWLIDDSLAVTMEGLVKRGFYDVKSNLQSNRGSMIVSYMKMLVTHENPNGTSAGALQKALCYMLFVSPWDHSLLGHAILFLDKFCSKVNDDSVNAFRGAFEEKYSGKTYDSFKTECKTLKSDLDPFINGSSGLSAVCHDNTNLFDTLWDNDKFLQYCTWLKRNLHHIIEALEKMSGESKTWNLSTIPHGSSAGPFKYGFVFKDIWGDSGYMSTLQEYISKLIDSDSGSLENFKSFLFNPSTPSSAGATAAGAAGGIFGIGGAGAGAAYGLNLFGFKNLVTGLISSFLK